MRNLTRRDSTKSNWAAALEANGMSPRGALASGTAKLLFWHCWQPVFYFWVLAECFSSLEPLQQAFGCAVGVREALYLLSVLVCTWVNPAYLLVDVGASVRDPDIASNEGSRRRLEGGYIFLAAYVLAPEKFIAGALFMEGGLNNGVIGVALLGGALLDLCGVGALGAGLGSGNLPPALAVGYCVTALGALVVLGGFAARGVQDYRKGEDWTFGAGRSCCGLLCGALLFCVPFALALSDEDGSISS